MPTACTHLSVDCHVHIYPFMSPDAVLCAAGDNIERLNGPLSGNHLALLLVADPLGVDGYARLSRCGENGRDDGWTREYGDDRLTVFRRPANRRIVALRGQQLISREGLEVLSPGTATVTSGLPLGTLIEAVSAANSTAIIPWGAGKWSGTRGRLLRDLLMKSPGSAFVLADNGNRPWIWHRVPHFSIASGRGIAVLAGSDPLPIPGEERRVGSYGFRLSVPRFDWHEPAAVLRVFGSAAGESGFFGRTMSVRRFASNQLRLRLH